MKTKKNIILLMLFISALILIYSCGNKNNETPNAAITSEGSDKTTENLKGEGTIMQTQPQTTENKQSSKRTVAAPTVYNITAPVAGNYPQGLFKRPNEKDVSLSYFTQTLEWIPKIEKTFAKDTQYTAVLTLAPMSKNQTFDGLTLDKVRGLPVNNVSDISSKIIDDSMVITIVFDKTAAENAEPELLFYDEFDGNALDETKWNVCPNWDRQGRSTWDDSLVSVNGGVLRLGVVRDEALGASKTSNETDAKNWLRAGAVRTRDVNNVDIIFENSFGYYEAKIKFPQVRGLWGAFWLMSETQGILTDEGTDGTEIDIVETIYSEKKQYNCALHWNGYGDKHKAVGSDASKLPKGINIYDGEFHTFALDWSPSAYIFYVDGVEFWRCDGGANFDNCGINQNPNYIKLTAEGAEWAGLLPVNFTECEMLVDYVRVYNQPMIK